MEKILISNKVIIKSLIVLMIMSIELSCEQEFDTPPLKSLPKGSVLTIANIRKLYDDSVRYVTGATAYRFTKDYSVYAVVTIDGKTGNLYKNVYVQDTSGAINLNLLSDGGLYEGDSVRIYLKGTKLSDYNGLLQIDSVDADKNIIKQKTGIVIKPLSISLKKITNKYQSHLLKLDSVEFDATELGKTYANAKTLSTENRLITDCNGKTIILRNSGYASFANTKLPEGNGSVIAVLGEYRGDLQLYIRRISEVIFTGTRCTGKPDSKTIILTKDFEDNNLTSGGWTQRSIKGDNQLWTTSEYSDNKFAKMSGYDGKSYENEDWLISRVMDISSFTNIILTFKTAMSYNGADIIVLISKEYDGTNNNPASFRWETLSPKLSTGSYRWVESGELDLKPYKSDKVYIAFKYTSTNSQSATWEVDDILVKGE